MANYAGTAWSFGLGLFFTGVYFRMLGASNYGLVAVAQTLAMFMQAGDIGLSASANREMARATADHRQQPAAILRTLGILNGSMACMVAVLLWIGTPWLVSNWINVGTMDGATASRCLRLAVLMLASQAMASFYSQALVGLQRQALLNGINSAFHALRHFGTWTMLAGFGPTIGLYFETQTVVTVIYAVVLCCTAASLVRAPAKTKWFDKAVLARCWRFGAASAGTTIIGMSVSQLDRLLLAKYLSLRDFGIYSVSANIAAYASRATIPLLSALYPRLTQLVEVGDRIGLERLYKRSTAYVGLITLPGALCIVAMASPVLVVFTGSEEVGAQGAGVLMLLVIGAALSAWSAMAYCLQQAHGNQTFALKVNAAGLFTYSPLLWFAISRWGAMGAAVAVCLFSAANFLIYPIYSAFRYLPRGGGAGYGTGFVAPLAFACVPIIAAHFVPWQPLSRTHYLLYCATLTALAYVSVVLGYRYIFGTNLLADVLPTTLRRRLVA